MFSKKESIALLISVLVLTFVFGFDDGSEVFVFSNWLINFIGIFLLATFAVLFRELIVKWFASRHDSRSEYETWNIHQVWFDKRLKRGIPFGIFLSLVLAFVSLGKFFFTAVGVHKFKENKNARVGRKFQNLSYYEEAQIASMSILSSLFLAVIGLLLGNLFSLNVGTFVGINFYIALFNMLPFSDLDGSKVFFGSLLTYIFLLVFIVIAFLLIKTSVVLGLLVALIIASLVMGIYYWKWS